jgi:SAM-dependent methyltransferase
MTAMDYEQIADWYDLYTSSQIDVPYFIEAAASRASVLELTSGTGRCSLPLIQAGVALTCVDQSAAMLRILRTKLTSAGLTTLVIQMDAAKLNLPERYDLVFIPFNSFSEFCDPREQLAVLAGVRAHLQPSGIFICTLHNPAVRRKLIDGQTHVRGEYPLPDGTGTLRLSSREQIEPDHCTVTGEQIYEVRDHEGRPLQRIDLPLRFVLHNAPDFCQMVESAGFNLLTIAGNYDNNAFEPDTSPFIITRFESAPD